MVERIFDATRRTLAEHGYDGASTNRIAAAAGVSPGSLYQYFPNKDAVVLAVVERYSDQLLSRVAACLVGQFDQPAPVVVRTTIEVLLGGLDVEPGFLRTVFEHGPRLDGGHRLRAFEQRIGELALAYLTTRRETLRAGAPLDAAVWVMVQAVEHLTVRYLLDRPPIPRDRFLDELTLLALGYLRANG
ncbi:TetR/AcrR family transcriptional regulator [Streptomyces sp. NPDC048277]|uniref:TetR/AcrR family transcriptional regulator n=1 Tax=Streptomyces sp. NPDC048277 TaxID=3155027 RepID=UPI00340EB111